MGAVTFAKSDNVKSGPFQGEYGETNFSKFRAVRGTITFSASYATGGDTLAPAACGLTQVVAILVDATRAVELPNRSGLSVELGGTTLAPTVLAFDANNTQVANATDLSARQAIPVMVLGFK